MSTAPGQQKGKRCVEEAKILVLGLPNSGKTSIIHELAGEVGLGSRKQGATDVAAGTTDVDTTHMHWNDVRLTVFNFRGKTDWRRPQWTAYFNQADAVVWVVDSTDRTHLETCREELLAMLGMHAELDGVPLLVYANKLDLDEDSPLDVCEIADHLDFRNQHNKILQERLWHIQSCSAQTGDGLEDGMDWLLEKITEQVPLAIQLPRAAAMSKTKGESLVNRWISIEYEDKHSKARWYKGLVKKYDRSSDRYLIVWETGGRDWVDELKDDEYKMAKPPAQRPDSELEAEPEASTLLAKASSAQERKKKEAAQARKAALEEEDSNLGAELAHVHQEISKERASLDPDVNGDLCDAESEGQVAQRPRQKAQIDFNDAIRFVNVVKAAYPSDDTYRRFLVLLQSYSMDRATIQDVNSQVQELFVDRPDLYAEFQKFLPDSAELESLEPAAMSKTKGESLVNRWISIEYEDKHSKARWYKGLVKKYDRSSDRYLIVWETGGQDWVDELKDDEYKMAKPPAQRPDSELEAEPEASTLLAKASSAQERKKKEAAQARKAALEEEDSNLGAELAHVHQEISKERASLDPDVNGDLCDAESEGQLAGSPVVQATVAAEQPMPRRVEDALGYLERVKSTFASNPKVYNDFLDIMKDFKNKSIDTPGVIRRVSRLFGHAHTDLILQFNTFLPIAYQIHAADLNDPAHPAYCHEAGSPAVQATVAAAQLPTPEQPPVPSKAQSPRQKAQIDFNDAIRFVNVVKAAYPGDDTYRRFLAILQSYSRELTIQDVHSQVQELFADRPDLCAEFQKFLPDSAELKAEPEADTD